MFDEIDLIIIILILQKESWKEIYRTNWELFIAASTARFHNWPVFGLWGANWSWRWGVEYLQINLMRTVVRVWHNVHADYNTNCHKLEPCHGQLYPNHRGLRNRGDARTNLILPTAAINNIGDLGNILFSTGWDNTAFQSSAYLAITIEKIK